MRIVSRAFPWWRVAHAGVVVLAGLAGCDHRVDACPGGFFFVGQFVQPAIAGEGPSCLWWACLGRGQMVCEMQEPADSRTRRRPQLHSLRPGGGQLRRATLLDSYLPTGQLYDKRESYFRNAGNPGLIYL
jgi:hypothetical protein